MDDAALIETSIRIAVNAHAGQRDKVGVAYILHPLRVMAKVRERGGSTAQQCAAVLHDVVEDTGLTLDDLGEEIVALVNAVTRPKNESYDSYVSRILAQPGAALIKEADARDNYSRLPAVKDEATRDRLLRKYAGILAALQAA